MRKMLRNFGTFLLLILLMPTVHAQNIKYNPVFCDQGHSLQEAIDRLNEGGLIDAYGTCYESVEIRTDNVGISTNSGASIIPPEGEPAITVRFASNVEIFGFNISLSDGGNGIQIINGASASISANHITGGGIGILVTERSHADLKFNYVYGNDATGIFITGSSQANLEQNMTSNNAHDGVAVVMGSSASIIENMAEENGAYGLRAQLNSTVQLFDGNEFNNNDSFGIGCESSAALLVNAVQSFSGNNLGSAEIVTDPHPPCLVDNRSGQAFP